MNEIVNAPSYLGFSNEENAQRVSDLVHAYNELHEKAGETTVTLSYMMFDNRFHLCPKVLRGCKSFTVRVENQIGLPVHPANEGREDTDEVLTDNGNMEDLLFQIIEEQVTNQGGIAT